MKVDYVANARSLGAHAIKAGSIKELKAALEEAKKIGPHHGHRRRNADWRGRARL